MAMAREQKIGNQGECFCLWIFDYLCALFNMALVEEEEEKINKVN